MRAIQNYIEETRPSMRTVYVDAQDFVSKYSEAGAIKDQEKVSFRNFRRLLRAGGHPPPR